MVAFALAVHVELLARLRAADAVPPPWWFGYARDATNLAAALMLWGGYQALGFAPPVALLAAMLTTLATYLFDWLIARGLKLRRARLLVALPLAAWVAVLAFSPEPIGRVLAELITAVRPVH
jgi:hypothetical protein